MKLLKDSEVAEMFQVKPSTLESWRCRGGGPDLPFIKLGHAVRYRQADVEKAIADGLRTRQAA